MKKKHIWILLFLVFDIIVLGIAFALTLKQSEKKFEALMAMPVKTIDLNTLSDGSYKGAYSIFPVNVEVTVEISEHKIVDIDIDKHINGQGKPAEVIIDEVVDQQSLEVDMISGATYSSRVILKAIEEALVQ